MLYLEIIFYQRFSIYDRDTYNLPILIMQIGTLTSPYIFGNCPAYTDAVYGLCELLLYVTSDCTFLQSIVYILYTQTL